MKQVDRITSSKFDAEGRAAWVDVRFGDGTHESFEIQRDTVADLLEALLRICSGLGGLRNNVTTLSDVATESAVALQSEEMDVREAPNDGAVMLFRVGCQDLSVLFPDRDARLLAARLLEGRRT